MAQLIKLRDYISRYELDIYRYPSQYIRLKQEKWQAYYQWWQSQPIEEKEPEQVIEKKSKSILKKLPLFRKKEVNEINEREPVQPAPRTWLKTEKDLRYYFLNELYPFQLKWASSSISHVSLMEPKYKNDPHLEYFLKRFPDNYFTMYYPVFNIKKAPVDAEIVLISPVQIEIIYLLDQYIDANVIVGDQRTWTIEKNNYQSKMISPIHALKRTEHLIKTVLKANNLSYPIQKTVLTKNNTIIYQQRPFNTLVIGKREYDEWFKARRSLDSPLKSQQLKVSDHLLKHCLTSSVRRPEWENDSDDFTSVGEE